MIYFDEVDEALDGHGWNVIDPNDNGGIAARFKSREDAERWAAEHYWRGVEQSGSSSGS